MGAAPVRLFHSTSELEALLAELGFEPRVVQIQPGPLQGRFQFSPAGLGAVVRFSSSADGHKSLLESLCPLWQRADVSHNTRKQ